MAQLSSVNTILVKDFDADGNLDALIAGNNYHSEMEIPRNDAGIGLFLKGNGHGQFEAQPAQKTGLYIKGEVRNGSLINCGPVTDSLYFLLAKNNDFIQLFRVSAD